MSEFGPITPVAWTVEQGVLSTLQNPPPPNFNVTPTLPRFVYYLAEYERQNGLPAKSLGQPPGPKSYRGGVDANTMMPEWFPMLHVQAQPQRTAERVAPTEYVQWYDFAIVATAGDDDEDRARMVAGAYAAAAGLCVLQKGDLGIGATSTVMTRMPNTELLNPDDVRQVVRSTVQFQTLIALVAQQNGPNQWPLDPYATPPEWVEVESIGIDVIAESLD